MFSVKYDGEHVMEILFGYDNKVSRKYTYEYNPDGSLAKKTEQYSSGQINEYTYTYNANGQLEKEVEVVSYTSGSRYEYTTSYSYNEAGLKVSAKSDKEYSNGTNYVYTYDNQNRLIEEYISYTYYDGEEPRYKYIYTYNADGSMATRTHHDYTNDTWVEEETIKYVYGTYYVYTAE